MNKFLALLAIFAAVFAAVDAQCPTIITRAAWGARAASTAVLPRRPAPWVIIHHTAGAACTTQAACSQQMRNIQSFHMDSNGWADIGYNLCVGGDGNAYIGRGWDRQGAHAPNFNNQSVGICFIGTFTSALPPAAALTAGRNLVTCGVSLGHISATYGLAGHRQVTATACPGQALFNNIQTWPRWHSNPTPVA